MLKYAVYLAPFKNQPAALRMNTRILHIALESPICGHLLCLWEKIFLINHVVLLIHSEINQLWKPPSQLQKASVWPQYIRISGAQLIMKLSPPLGRWSPLSYERKQATVWSNNHFRNDTQGWGRKQIQGRSFPAKFQFFTTGAFWKHESKFCFWGPMSTLRHFSGYNAAATFLLGSEE